ncbi:ThiF family adenylyltransferase [Sphingomonas sp. AOB5]|uniref:ThiF family adenylyltransferase n=1 Tax=Sphingomonas sp. AOB5 TaxID=3034017 RepID=UPI0023F8D8B1|nr:ThiF family adenylyltransferase [Sphingomonas sp. AOB5]MDF7774273.1 ThiF family adenylyltransferase [Sphingomonas sp. AOB5]
MANILPLGIDRAGAIARLESWLIGTLGALRLGRVRSGSTDGWRIKAEIASRILELDIEIPDEYPRKLPQVFLANPPAFGTWPHVESNGRLCITSPSDRYDRTRPTDVVKALLDGAFDILDKGITGANEDDFRSEFLSYWDITATGPYVQSLLDPSGPSRAIKLWRGKRLCILSESRTDIRRWLGNLGKARVAEVAIKDAALLWLDRPLLPREYPKTVADLYEIAGGAADNAVELLDRLLRSANGHIFTVIIGAVAGNGACFGGVELELRRIDRGRKKRGTYQGASSPQVRLGQWKEASLTRTRVERADAFWIHGRDSNPDLLELRTAKIALVGCGSLGSPVARLLALAGVGKLDLMDPEMLEWANVGRHVLGVAARGKNKAIALAEQLGREFPHSQFAGHGRRWQECAETLEGCDLIISTTGMLDDEAELTMWQRDHTGKEFVFGWTEPRGCAAQAVAILPGAGCLLCGFDLSGDPEFQATKWTEVPLQREAACGNWFMPYGAGEIMSAAVLTTELALGVLTERASPGNHRILSCRTEILEAAGGEWTPAWLAATSADAPGGRAIERHWLPDIQCPACQGKGPA